jgi:hypothetical protein
LRHYENAGLTRYLDGPAADALSGDQMIAELDGLAAAHDDAHAFASAMAAE